MEKLNLTQEWDKVFPKSDKVDHKKVTFHNRYGITLAAEMKRLLDEYNGKKTVTLEDILTFHVRFERIHPLQDGNGRVGRLILFKECLKYNIVPFIIEDSRKMFYYRGLQEWDREKGYLTDTCLSAQDTFKKYLNYFRIPYEN